MHVTIFANAAGLTDEQVRAIAADVAAAHPSVDVGIATEGAVIDL